jgi:Mn2+/Fe2+ NRAMP family transporter
MDYLEVLGNVLLFFGNLLFVVSAVVSFLVMFFIFFVAAFACSAEADSPLWVKIIAWPVALMVFILALSYSIWSWELIGVWSDIHLRGS